VYPELPDFMETTLKKTFAALACAAATVAAHGQSSVTVYGSLDLSAGRSETGSGTTLPGGAGTSTAPSQRMYRLDSGTGYGSRLGFRGLEDLGGGLNARFVLEMGVAVDTGGLNQGGLAWGRQAYVGVGGNGWTLTMGRQYSPMNNAIASSEATGGGYWGSVINQAIGIYESMGSTAGNGSFQMGARIDNSVLLTANSGPFTGYAMAGAGNENARGTGRFLSLAGTYADGPLKANLVYARMRQNIEQITATATPEWLSQWSLNGSYNFGPAALYAGYFVFNGPKNRGNLSAAATPGAVGANARAFSWDKNQIVWVGVRAPVGANNVLVQVARQTFPYTGAPDGRATLYAIVGEHLFSKRTLAYVNFGAVTNNDRSNVPLFGGIPQVGPNGYGADARAVSVGLRHTF
jgi:predicted porin